MTLNQTLNPVALLLAGNWSVQQLLNHAALLCKSSTSGPRPPLTPGCRRQIGGFASWANLASADALVKLAPTLAATFLLWGIMKFAPLCGGTRFAPLAPLLLPAALVAIPVVFQVVLMATGTSRQAAADAGWVLQPKVRRWVQHLL